MNNNNERDKWLTEKVIGELEKPADITQDLIPLYRGTGKRGFTEGLRVTEGGVYGDGTYFYTEPAPARSHATTGGGVITGYVRPEDVEIHGNVAVLKDPSKFMPRGKISVEDTLSTGVEWVDKTEKALAERPSLESIEASVKVRILRNTCIELGWLEDEEAK
jgi:hypothetical protein